MEISNDIKYIGVNDHEIDLFEGMYDVPNGMAYNSYVILDEKIAVMDTVDTHFGDEWLGNLKSVLGGKTPDYLVIQHMEPDHSANIKVFAEKYPNAKIVASAKAFVMMAQFFGNDFADKQVVVGENDTLPLGKHTLTFITAPMVHWPEVIMTYDNADKALFSADGFGKFGALDADEDWACEARRYYFGIVGKYGAQVQSVLKKAAGLDIQKILPLHGPVLTENLGYYLNLYNIWPKRRRCYWRKSLRRTAAQRSLLPIWRATIWRRLSKTRSATVSLCLRLLPTTRRSSRLCATLSCTSPSATIRTAR